MFTRCRELAVVVSLVTSVAACGAHEPQTEAARAALRRRADAKDTVAAGISHTCIARLDGTVSCFGLNDHGQLGNDSLQTSAVPVPVHNLTRVTAVAVGASWSMALRSDGTVWRWGVFWGQPGNPQSGVAVQLPWISDVVSIGGGDFFSCAVRKDGHVWCWGVGPLGNGPINSSPVPVEVAGISNAVSVSGGNSHACALLADGTARCWGSNTSGQLGDGTYNPSDTPVTVVGLSQAIDVSAGGGSGTCALVSDGTVRCWGSNQSGQLGVGSLSPQDSPVPVQVVQIRNAIAVDHGWSMFACALLANGTERCWGTQDHGQLGDGQAGALLWSTVPTQVAGLTGATTLSSGHHSCAVRADGSAVCWGQNGFGQLGNGFFVDSAVPVNVQGFGGGAAQPKVAAGSRHSCGLRASGTVKCWGRNTAGQLGNGNLNTTATPTLVFGLSNVIDLAAGIEHTCALQASGNARCWGRNADGELGDGGASGASSAFPVSVTGLTDAVAIAAGGRSACAIRWDGAVVCWGAIQGSSLPGLVPGLDRAVAIELGQAHACALRADGTVACWGSNASGQLGDGTLQDRPTPVTVLGGAAAVLGDVVSIAAGDRHTCATLADGSSRCWGSNVDGQLGLGNTTSPQPLPALVLGSADTVDATGGARFSCWLGSGGGGRCSGSNSIGQLGIGAGAGVSTPGPIGTPPTYFQNMVALEAGGAHACAMRGDATVWCWGSNADGQVGDGTFVTKTTPVQVVSFP